MIELGFFFLGIFIGYLLGADYEREKAFRDYAAMVERYRELAGERDRLAWANSARKRYEDGKPQD